MTIKEHLDEIPLNKSENILKVGDFNLPNVDWVYGLVVSHVYSTFQNPKRIFEFVYNKKDYIENWNWCKLTEELVSYKGDNIDQNYSSDTLEMLEELNRKINNGKYSWSYKIF